MFDRDEELLDQIRLGEDSRLELKSARFRGKRAVAPHRNSLADEMAAFANSQVNGVLLLGVDDKSREVEGIPIEKLDSLERLVLEAATDTIEPPLRPRIFRIRLPAKTGEMRPLLKVEISKSLFVHKSPGGYFIRSGSSKRELRPEELARLFQQRSQARLIRFDEQPVPDSSFGDLQEGLWQRFVQEDSPDERGVLRKRRILADDDEGRECATVAGVLLCCARPERFLPSAFIQAVRYKGRQRDSNYQLDAREITGPAERQIEDALAFVRRNMTIAAIKVPDRRDIPQYSERAAFEAIVNAVAHRDYSLHRSKIRLFMFDDRLELYSPGALPNSITVDSLHLRQATRNELLTHLLSDIPVQSGGAIQRKSYIEKRGEGVPIIFSASEALSGRRPIYDLIDESELRLTIPAAKPPHGDG